MLGCVRVAYPGLGCPDLGLRFGGKGYYDGWTIIQHQLTTNMEPLSSFIACRVGERDLPQDLLQCPV